MAIVQPIREAFAWMAGRVSAATGSVWAFTSALFVLLIWAVFGPVYHFSDTWQLVINTSTTIVTFLMVFVIQHAQNRELRAVQFKLNELLAAQEGASNRLLDIEDLSEKELEHLYERFRHLARNAARLGVGAHTSIDSEPDLEDNPPSGRRAG